MESNSLFEQCDFHVHSRLSPCAQGDMRLSNILDACVRTGIEYLGITDHIFSFTDPAIVVEARREITSLATKPIKVFLGCEADVTAVGKHMVTDEMKSTLDFIMVSANHFHAQGVVLPEDDTPRSVARHFLRMFRYACSLDFVDVIAHPLVMMMDMFDPKSLDLIDEVELRDAVSEAKANGIAMEISPRALAKDQMSFRLKFYSLCKELGLKFSIGSDSHRLENVGRTRILGSLIKALGITDDDIWLPESLMV